MKRLEAPHCHWGSCPGSNKEMFLIGETEEAWLFAHGCGTTRAVVKPATREKSIYAKYSQDIEYIKRVQKFRTSRPAFSFPTEVKR